jgi:hypothetical protein
MPKVSLIGLNQRQGQAFAGVLTLPLATTPLQNGQLSYPARYVKPFPKQKGQTLERIWDFSFDKQVASPWRITSELEYDHP